MKKIGLVLICVLLIAAVSGALAQGEIELLGGLSMEEATVLQDHHFAAEIAYVYENGGKEKQGEGWYAFYAPEDGICTVRAKSYVGQVCSFTLLDKNGERLEKEYFEPNESWKKYTFNVYQGERYYLHFERGVSWKWACAFSICVGNKHNLSIQDRVVQEATCTKDGVLARNCELCGEQIVSGSISAKGHQPGLEEIIRQATCLAQGQIGVTCVVCREIISSSSIPVAEHILGQYTDVRLPTCTAEGIRIQYCQTCNATMNTETVAALGHAPEEWKQVQMESCTSVGLREKRCAVCGVVLAVEELPMKGHQYSEWTTTVNPTKEAEGEQISACLYCGDVKRESIPKIEKLLGIF